MTTATETKITPKPLRSEILKIVVIYSIFGGLWIYLSDTFLGLFTSDPAVMAKVSIYKGLVFIALTASFLYLLISYYTRRISLHISELNQAQHMLSRQKALLDIVVEGTTDAVYVKDVDGRYLLANTAVTNFVKKPIEDILGNNDSHLFPSDEAKALMAQDQWVMTQDSPQTYEECITTPDGVRYFLSTKGAVHDENGVVTGIFGVARDISERKQAEADLKKSEDKFNKAFNASPEAISINSIDDGKYIDVNEVFIAITGFKKNEVIDHTSAELGFWLDLDERHQFIAELSKTGSVKNYDVRYRMKNKEERDFLVSSEIIEIDGKRCNLNFMMDITERKLAEDAVKESEFFFKESQRAANIGSYKTDFTLGYWKPSEVLSNIFGIDNKYDCSIQGWIDIVHPEDRDMMAEYLRVEVISKRNPFSKEYRIIRKNDGETRWVNGLGEATFNSKGDILTLCGTIQDITERKQVEEERQNFQKQLLLAQKMESLGVLAAGIAHDFNNILTAIMGNISYAKMDHDASQHSYEPLVRAEKAAKRAANLAKQFLAFSKGGEPIKKPISIRESVEDAVSLVLSGSSVEAYIDLPTDLDSVNADEGQISQAFHNIIINAVQAMPDGGRLTVSARNIAITEENSLGLAAGEYVEISFTDEGFGIAAEDVERIFDPYFTNKVGGSGLGLASTYAIIKKHSGHISVSSSPGKGTTFTIVLPGCKELVSEELKEAYVPGYAHGVYSILVMDDDEMVRELADITLKRFGYEVVCCDNGAAAVSLYQTTQEEGVPFSLVIMDLTIPGGMGGIEAARQILAFDPEAQLIVSSGYSDDPVMANFSEYGFCAALEKPYNIEELTRILQKTKRR